ncbi:MAG: multicopper oxidase family protein [Geminicoccaceae bacterium]
MKVDLRITRRSALGLIGAGLSFVTLVRTGHAESPKLVELTAMPSGVSLMGPTDPSTNVWAFNGDVPGPTIRTIQGDRLRVVVTNKLPEPTTVHWHGLCVANEMDGVPYLSQPPIEPGETFIYEFDLKDAGTYWYHPHFNSAEQTERGLYGALIVEELDPPEVDREVIWILDDWAMNDQAVLHPFGDLQAAGHAGRLGTLVTINGRIDRVEVVRGNERIRLRLVNAANARTFGLGFKNQHPWIIALDGQPVQPHRPPGDRVVLAPGMRTDLMIDVSDRRWSTVVVDDYFDGPHYAYELARFTYTKVPPLRTVPLPAPVAMPANPIAEPNLSAAERHQIVLEGGAIGGLKIGLLNGERRDGQELAQQGLLWAMNGHVHDGVSAAEPLLKLKLGASYLLELINRTIFEHSIYLHGHKFRVVTRDGRSEPFQPFRDTVLLGSQERVKVAFVADNPGRWLLHCSVFEHQQTGMMAIIDVA